MPSPVAFDIDAAMVALRAAVAPFPPAALFQLYDEGFRSPFEHLVACIISIRTRDETTLPVARRLLSLARTPAALLERSEDEILTAMRGSAFAVAKVSQLMAIARRVEGEFGGALPCDYLTLTSLPGVGAKCANLVLGIACGQPKIGVDIHVHRIANRWGYVRATTPGGTLVALEQILPRKYWVEINRLLVPFGKHICAGTRPRCSSCPLLAMCSQIGVIDSR